MPHKALFGVCSRAALRQAGSGTCAVESRSRSVTVPSSSVCRSMVSPKGTPSSSVRAYRRPMLTAAPQHTQTLQLPCARTQGTPSSSVRAYCRPMLYSYTPPHPDPLPTLRLLCPCLYRFTFCVYMDQD